MLPAPSAGADNVTLQVHVAANLNAISSVVALVMTGLAEQGGQEVELEAQAEGGQHDAGANMNERTLRQQDSKHRKGPCPCRHAGCTAQD